MKKDYFKQGLNKFIIGFFVAVSVMTALIGCVAHIS